MNPWTAFVGALQDAFLAAGEALGGSLALGVFVLTLAVRLLLIPIMLPLARRGRAWREKHRTIKPEIKRITKEHRDDPSAMQRELKALHASAGIGQVDTAGLLGALIQLPVLIAFFTAVIHLSDGTPLGEGGVMWGLVAGALSWLSTRLGDRSTPKAMLWIAGLLPIAIAAWLGRGVGLYLVAFYLGSLVQSLLMGRGPEAPAGPAGRDEVAAASGG